MGAEAAANARLAIDLDHTDPRHILNLCWGLWLQGHDALAEQTMLAGLKQFPDDDGLLSFAEDVGLTF